MAMNIALEFEPSLITKCKCNCEGLCLDCKDEVKFWYATQPDFTVAGEVAWNVRREFGCKTHLRLYVQDLFVPEDMDISILADQLIKVKGSKIKPRNHGHDGESAAAGDESDVYLDPSQSDFDSKSDDSGMSSEESDEQDYDDAILDTGSDESLSQRLVEEEKSVHSSVLNEPSETSEGRGDRQNQKRPLNSDEEDEDSGTKVKQPKTIRLQCGSALSTTGLTPRVSGLKKHASLPAESGGYEMTDASASVSLPTRPVLSARRPSKNVCKVNIKEVEIRKPEKIGPKPSDQIPDGSTGSTTTDVTIDIPFLKFVSKMGSIPTVYPATGKKYHWDHKASHRNKDLASGRVIKFKADAKLKRIALLQAKHSTLKSQGNSLNWILKLRRWSAGLGFFVGQGILVDEDGTALKKSLADECFLKPEDFWIVAEDDDD